MIEAEEILDPLAVLSHDPRRTWVLGSCLKETWKGQKVLKRVVNWAILALNKIFIKKKSCLGHLCLRLTMFLSTNVSIRSVRDTEGQIFLPSGQQAWSRDQMEMRCCGPSGWRLDSPLATFSLPPAAATCDVLSCSVMSNSVTPWTVARQVPLPMGFSRQEYWSGLPFLTPECSSR